jgi:hypothetical protein
MPSALPTGSLAGARPCRDEATSVIGDDALIKMMPGRRRGSSDTRAGPRWRGQRSVIASAVVELRTPTLFPTIRAPNFYTTSRDLT